MPELPEVETIRRGIAPHIEGRTISSVVIRERRLRWPITPGLKQKLCGNRVARLYRRGKYLLLTMPGGVLLIHLGMSGRLRILPELLTPEKHDHVDIIFAGGPVLRYTDPRRFGCMLWVTRDPLKHSLLAGLGPEPLEKAFDGQYLFDVSRGKKLPVKSLVMDSHIVVGVGNIYANEALFLAAISPLTPAGSLTRKGATKLAKAIKKVLKMALKSGGTTLKDFVSAEGKPGYFQQQLSVYGRGGLPCVICGTTLTESRMASRSTVYCVVCQEG
jgi:formamidopyrimidine-DNA glycosylase